MTGIEKIVEKIREDADADYRRVVDEAKAQADAIMSDAAVSARSSAAQVIADAEAQSAEIERRAVSMAGLEVRKMRLEQKQKVLQQAFDQALSQLTSLPESAVIGDDYVRNPGELQVYSMDFLPSALPIFAAASTPSAYEQWVLQHCLSVPEETRAGVLAWWEQHGSDVRPLDADLSAALLGEEEPDTELPLCFLHRSVHRYAGGARQGL